MGDDIESAIKSAVEILAKNETPESRFVEMALATRAVWGHPDTVAAIERDGRWAESFPTVRLIADPIVERGRLLTGSAMLFGEAHALVMR
jgi:murein endopeptidase